MNCGVIARCTVMLLALVLSLRVGANGQIVLATLAAAAIIVRVSTTRHFEILITALGALVALLPCMGSPVLLVFALFVLALSAPRFALSTWGVAFLCVCGATTLVMCLRDFWAHDFISIITFSNFELQATWQNAREGLRVSPFPAILALEHTSRWLGLCLIAGVFSDRRELLARFLSAVLLGFVISVLLGVSDLAQLLPFALPSPGAFWRATGRAAFTLTDPNALGVFSLLVTMLCAVMMRATAASGAASKLAKNTIRGVAVLSLIAGLYSGSRTFFFGLFLWTVVLLWLKRRRWCYFALVCSALLVLALNALLLVFDAGSSQNVVNTLPLGLQRLIASLSFSSFDSAVSSRVIFNRAAINMWLDYPIFGVGIGQFILAVQPYLSNASGWSDNANNFYLGILAETGLLGFAAFLIPLLKVRVRLVGDSVDAAGARVLIVFLFILVLGPHLEFDEVALTIGSVASLIETRDGLRFGWRFFILALLLAILPMQSSSFGLYPPEPDGTQWTARRARFERVANADGEVHVDFQILNPSSQDYPIMISVSSNRGEVRNLLQAAAGIATQQLVFKCESAANWYVKRPCRLMISLESSAGWVPAWFGQGVDRRNLGVRLINPQN